MPRVLLLHLFFVLLPLVALVLLDDPRACALLAALVFVALFTLAHDAMHRSLGLSHRANESVLTTAGALIGVSGTAARAMHFVHHARPGSAEDFEGRALHGSIGRALIVSPFSYFELPFRAFARTRSATRSRQLLEWTLVLALFAAAVLAGGRARLYAEVCLVAQLTIQIWASRLPHRAPQALLAAARLLVWTHAPLVLAFVFHDLHHRKPHLSVFDLPERTGIGVGLLTQANGS